MSEQTPMPSFKYIRAWEKWMGAFPDYTELQVGLAVDFGAPADAIYYMRDKDTWAVLGDIASPLLREQIEKLAEKFDE